MKHLYAPWRSSYAKSNARSKQEHITNKECVFCSQIKLNNDNKNFVLKRLKHTTIILNRFPYNTGHILILPIAHKATLEKLSKPARTELMELLTQSSQLLKKKFKADGINIGLNLGKGAGAGIPSHLHFHVLPRWHGDTNFLPLLADTKQISFDLHEVYEQLTHLFKQISI